ncbi:MAG: hypothetical protein IJE07_04390 [Clostridia bacterium]|nr:hypothetical protein [Clostridia bacterium]
MSMMTRNRRAGRTTEQQEHQQPPVQEAPPAPDEAPPVPPEAAPAPAARDLMATNTGVRLACTMAAMMGLFALFLCWAEQESRVIRRFSVQSACLTALHVAAGVTALLLSGILGGVPYIGLMVTLLSMLGYIAALVLLVVVRLQLMRHAWQGVGYLLPPALERVISRYY